MTWGGLVLEDELEFLALVVRARKRKGFWLSGAALRMTSLWPLSAPKAAFEYRFGGARPALYRCSPWSFTSQPNSARMRSASTGSMDLTLMISLERASISSGGRWARTLEASSVPRRRRKRAALEQAGVSSGLEEELGLVLGRGEGLAGCLAIALGL